MAVSTRTKVLAGATVVAGIGAFAVDRNEKKSLLENLEEMAQFADVSDVTDEAIDDALEAMTSTN